MDRQEFAELVKSIQVKKVKASTGPMITMIYPDLKYGFSAAANQEAFWKRKKMCFVDLFNAIITQVAYRVGYPTPSEFHISTYSELNEHLVNPELCTQDKNGVYIRTKREYNNHGSGNRGSNMTKRKENTHMKNRKVTLTLITLLSGAPLQLQITGSAKDATGWTRFLDVDNGMLEYEKSNWTEDKASENQAAVDAIDAMIQIEEDYVAGKLSPEDALEQFKAKYVEWVIAHLQTKPSFVERRIVGLNVDKPMSVYTETEAESEPEIEEAAE